MTVAAGPVASPAALPPVPEMYDALCRRDATYEGVFVVGVRTTSIFCRPTCPARKPKAENVEFFPSARDALHAGYRPCRRCRPLESAGVAPAWVRDLLATVDADPARRITDADLRARAVDPARARRYFRRHYGMTFHAYHRARRMGLALRAVRDGADVTTTGLAHGFDSTSGFRDAFARHFGTVPSDPSSVTMLTTRWLDSPLGPMLAVADDRGVHLLEFVDRRAIETQIAVLRRRADTTGRRGAEAVLAPGDHPHLDTLADELDRYFAGSLPGCRFTVPIVAPGTPFQESVWTALRAIPVGATCSYADLAARIGRPGAVRAVGRANGDNRVAIIIPCHRVVGADGSLCGYGGGLWRKRRLLEIEARAIARGG